MSVAPAARFDGAQPYGAEPGTQISTLENGLRVVTRSRRETKAVALNLAVLAGSRDENETTAGAAHVMEHLFCQGTDRARTTDDVLAPIVARGGTFNAGTEREMIGFFVDAPATALPVALEQLGDVIVVEVGERSRQESLRPALAISGAYREHVIEKF